MNKIVNYDATCPHQRTIVEMVQRVNKALGYERFIITQFNTYAGLRPHEASVQFLYRERAGAEPVPYLEGIGGINCQSMLMFFNGALAVLNEPKEKPDNQDVRVINDHTYYVHNFEQLSQIVDNLYWPVYGQSDRGSCIEGFRNTFTYPTIIKLSNYYAPCGELYSVSASSISPEYIRDLYAAL